MNKESDIDILVEFQDEITYNLITSRKLLNNN